MDSETRSRIEVIRLKKNVEGDLSEMELQLSYANRQVSEATKSLGQLQTQVKLDDSTHLSSELKEQVAMAERPSSLLQSELEELRSLYKQTECGCRLAEEELLQAMEAIFSIPSQKRRLEVDVGRMQNEAEEAVQRCQNAEEKAKKAATE
ncbi:hypothetical protein GH733_003081, partial [Mirounga leonina]